MNASSEIREHVRLPKNFWAVHRVGISRMQIKAFLKGAVCFRKLFYGLFLNSPYNKRSKKRAGRAKITRFCASGFVCLMHFNVLERILHETRYVHDGRRDPHGLSEVF